VTAPYYVPYQAAEAEFTEKKSRFIGRIYKIDTADAAADILKDLQKRLWDASHHVYAYILRSGAMRFSDDGEPQGTAGMPTLEVLRRAGVCDALCVTTRYFGGVLLGAGGLTRAYARAAALALDAAGIAEMTPYAALTLTLPYPLLDSVRKTYIAADASETDAAYTDLVTLNIALPDDKLDSFTAHITELSAGKLTPERTGTVLTPRLIRPPSGA
jgi:uncharacterized YigZ family protein